MYKQSTGMKEGHMFEHEQSEQPLAEAVSLNK
jgi:hypothetical protein